MNVLDSNTLTFFLRNHPLLARWAMKTTRSFVLFFLSMLVFSPPVAAEPPEEALSWTAQPDPLPWKMEADVPANKEIHVGKTGAVVNPTTTSPFACVVLPAAKNMPHELKMIDLRSLEQVGQTVKIEKIDPRFMRVSPWGDAVAAVDGKADKPTVTVWSFDGDKTVHSVVIHDSKLAVEGYDFAGKGQLLTVKQIRDVKKNDIRRLWEVWDIKTGKQLTSIQFQLEYDVRWISFSPGRKYLVMEESTNDGYSFLIWDLATGKLAGKVPLQTRKEQFGICGGISFSPDGKEAALLWKLGESVPAKIMRFDIEKGVKKGEHTLHDEVKPSEPGFLAGGMRTFQFLPDGRGWLLSGHQIVERESGKVVWKVASAPGTKLNTADRRFADGYHVSTLGDKKFGDKKLSLIALPKAELDAAIKQAGAK